MKSLSKSIQALFFLVPRHPAPLLSAGEVTRLSWSQVFPSISSRP
jgi:hypothetical protein